MRGEEIAGEWEKSQWSGAAAGTTQVLGLIKKWAVRPGIDEFEDQEDDSRESHDPRLWQM